MCTLAIYRHASRRYPLVLAANRDEFFNRPALAPRRLDELPDVVAGRDLSAGGTWLASRVAGPFLVAGLLNRRSLDPARASAPGSRSRGRLPLIAAACASVDEARTRVELEDLPSYGSFNLLVADRDRAVVLDNGGPVLRQTQLGPGLSVLTNLDVNDPRCPRLATAYPAFEALGSLLAEDPPLTTLTQHLRKVLSDHESSADPGGTNPFARVCIHLEHYGTRSSTIVVLQDDGRVRYLHAEGPPCLAPFSEVAC
jgi:uncharacterized protein with NRDE domain